MDQGGLCQRWKNIKLFASDTGISRGKSFRPQIVLMVADFKNKVQVWFNRRVLPESAD